jgi:hypothetical protein
VTKIISSRLDTDLLYYRLQSILTEMSDVAEAEVVGELRTSEDLVTAIELMMTRLTAEYIATAKAHSALATDFMALSTENVALQRELNSNKRQVELAVALVDALTEAPKDTIIIDDALERLIEGSSATITSEYKEPLKTVDVDVSAIDDCEIRISAEKFNLRVGLKEALKYYIDTIGHKVIDEHRN